MAAANDNPPPEAPRARLVPLIGEVRDDGRVARYRVVPLLRIAEADLVRRGRQEP